MSGSKQQTNAQAFPAQHQSQQPGIEAEMNPRPQAELPNYWASGKLKDKVALITGGDSGIGRAVAYAYAKEGADIVMVYLNEHGDALETRSRIEELGRQCLSLAGDVGDPVFCGQVIEQTLQKFAQLDILVNNAAEQHPQNSLLDIADQQLERTFRTNVFANFYLTRAALPHLQQGASIINTVSITAYEGNEQLIDYSSTKGAMVSFTRSLAKSLVKLGIRVNGVAPGPVWTPLIPASYQAEQVASFGTDTPMGRAGQPSELAGAYVFLASGDATYITGQVLHVNGGVVLNG